MILQIYMDLNSNMEKELTENTSTNSIQNLVISFVQHVDGIKHAI